MTSVLVSLNGWLIAAIGMTDVAKDIVRQLQGRRRCSWRISWKPIGLHRSAQSNSSWLYALPSRIFREVVRM